MKAAVIIGPKKVAKLVDDWSNEKPITFESKGMVVGMGVEKNLELQNGIKMNSKNRQTVEFKLIADNLGITFSSKANLQNRSFLTLRNSLSTALFNPVDKPKSEIVFAENSNSNLSIISICEMISLACNTYVMPTLIWHELGDLLPFRTDFQCKSYSEILATNGTSELSIQDLKRANKLHQKRNQISEQDSWLEFSIRRWVKSTGEAKDIHDRCIELRIALDCLFMKNLKGPGGRVGDNLANCCAWYLGNDAKQREEIYSSVSNFYRASSGIIHGSPNTNDRELEKKYEAAHDYCRKSIIKLLDSEP